MRSNRLAAFLPRLHHGGAALLLHAEQARHTGETAERAQLAGRFPRPVDSHRARYRLDVPVDRAGRLLRRLQHRHLETFAPAEVEEAALGDAGVRAREAAGVVERLVERRVAHHVVNDAGISRVLDAVTEVRSGE